VKTKRRKSKVLLRGEGRRQVPMAAYRYFGLTCDPFTTLSLQPHNLDFFVGRENLLERLSSDMASLSNTGLAGEPGVGKSSFLKMLESRMGKGFHRVSIGVPLDDAEYFLSELLREILAVVKKVPGLNLEPTARRLREGDLNKNEMMRIAKAILSKSKKPVLLFVDDVEKIRGDHVRHLTRSDRTLQFLEELKSLFESRNACVLVTLQEEFYSKITQMVKEGAEPTVLGLFKNIVLVDKFDPDSLARILRLRLKRSGWKKDLESFLEPEGMNLALSLSHGNPRRFLYLVSEGMARAFLRKAKRVEFLDVFEALNEHLKLDLVCRKLLFFLSKSGRAMAANGDLQSFMGLDAVSLNRRFEILVKNRLADSVDVVEGSKVYSLPGFAPTGEEADSRPAAPGGMGKQGYSLKGEKMYLLDEEAEAAPRDS